MVNVLYIINILLEIYLWIVFIRAILSWVRPNPYNPIVRFICRLVDPVTYWISRYIPTRFGMMDISPLILMLIIMILKEYVIRALIRSLLGIGV